MMTDIKAYRFYMSIKLHFTNPKFNVFQNKGNVRISYDSFLKRNDYKIFERLARHFPKESEYIQYIASNFMYGNSSVIYNQDDGIINYREFIRRKESITKIFFDDLDYMINSDIEYNFDCLKIPDIMQLWFSNKITLETLVILNDLDDIVNIMRNNNQISLLLNDHLLRIEKSKNFVKYNSYKIMNHYLAFKEDILDKKNSSFLNNLGNNEYQQAFC